MTELSFSDAEYVDKHKQTRRETFLAEMEQVVPWEALLGLIEPAYPKAGNGRRPYAFKTCCASTCCRIGSATAIRRWKKRCTKWPNCAGYRFLTDPRQRAG